MSGAQPSRERVLFCGERQLADDRFTYFQYLFNPAQSQMADQNEPKKETVRITLPPRPAGQPPAPSTGRDTVRINMPARPPSSGTALRPPVGSGASGVRPPTAQTLVPPAPSKPVAPPPVYRKAP